MDISPCLPSSSDYRRGSGLSGGTDRGLEPRASSLFAGQRPGRPPRTLWSVTGLSLGPPQPGYLGLWLPRRFSGGHCGCPFGVPSSDTPELGSCEAGAWVGHTWVALMGRAGSAIAFVWAASPRVGDDQHAPCSSHGPLPGLGSSARPRACLALGVASYLPGTSGGRLQQLLSGDLRAGGPGLAQARAPGTPSHTAARLPPASASAVPVPPLPQRP